MRGGYGRLRRVRALRSACHCSRGDDRVRHQLCRAGSDYGANLPINMPPGNVLANKGNEDSSPKPKKKYVNNNPEATDSEKENGEFLNDEAQDGELPGIKEVAGKSQPKGKGRKPDYEITKSDGSTSTGDLLEPETANTKNIEDKITKRVAKQKPS